MATAAQPSRFTVTPDVLDRLGAAMKPITGDDVFNMVRDAKVVLVGESRHAQHAICASTAAAADAARRAATARTNFTVRAPGISQHLAACASGMRAPFARG